MKNQVPQYATRVVDRFPLFKPNRHSVVRRKPVFGVGINDSSYITNPMADGKRLNCPIYVAWKSMIERCYYTQYQTKRPTYIGCTVDPEWLLFSNFHKWMVEQDWVGKALDKDILGISSKHYSPENCLFVTLEVNNLLCCDRGARRGDGPVGVRKRGRKFRAQFSFNGTNKALGIFDTPEGASKAYRAAKKANIERVAREQTCTRTRDGLLKHAAMLS